MNPDLRLLLARSCLAAFVRYTMPDYMMGWLHAEICAELDQFLEDVVAGRSPRLMLTMPPRHGKSELASRRFPAYVLGRYPDMSIISASYSADLSSRMNRDVQRIMDDPVYRLIFPETRLSGKNIRTIASGSYLRNSDIFEIVGHRGVYRSAGVGGGLTGMGASICILDDVIKDRASADSPTVLQNVWDWYTSTLYTRLAPGGGIILMNTRWSQRDLSGRLLEAEAQGDGDCWRVVNFPAIAETDEEHRKAGEALHPERYPLDQLLKIKAAVGSRDWASLYQQHPYPDGGTIFRSEWLQRTWTPKDLPERFDQIVQSWDMTFKGGSFSDFTVGQVWGRKGGDFYLLDQLRGRWSFTESVAKVRELSEKWPLALLKLIEDAANGPAVIDMLKREIPGIVPVKPDGSKTARAHAVTAIFESGNVILPDRGVAPWIDEWRAEMEAFPSGAHDDCCDACSQALRRLQGSRGLHLSEGVTRQVNAMQRQMQARARMVPGMRW